MTLRIPVGAVPIAYRMHGALDGKEATPCRVGIAQIIPSSVNNNGDDLRIFSRKPCGVMVELISHGTRTEAVSIDTSAIPYPCLIIPYPGK